MCIRDSPGTVCPCASPGRCGIADISATPVVPPARTGYILLRILSAHSRIPSVHQTHDRANFDSSMELNTYVQAGTSRMNQKLDIVVVSDASSDQTVDRVNEFIGSGAGRQVELVSQARRAGKARGVNLAVAKGTGNIVVFADARQSFAKDTIPQLVARFGDARVGAVSGSLEIERAGTNAGAGVDAYWRLEKFIRRTESVLGASIG